MLPFNEPLALITRSDGTRDGDGNTTLTTAASLVYGIFAPGGSTENTDAQQRTVDQPSVLLPPGETVGPIDAVVVNPVLDGGGQFVLDGNGAVQGDWYEVDGRPDVWRHPSGWTPGIQVRLKRVTG